MCSGCGIYLRVEEDRVEAFEPPEPENPSTTTFQDSPVLTPASAEAETSTLQADPARSADQIAEFQSMTPLDNVSEISPAEAAPAADTSVPEPAPPLDIFQSMPPLSSVDQEQSTAASAANEQPSLTPAELPPSQNEMSPFETEPGDMTPQLFDDSGADLLAESRPEAGVDVSAFANSEVSAARDGHYLYDVIITRIDSKEIRERLREALDDRRMGWRVDELLARVRNGRLDLPRLNPVHASIVVQRCKSLPLKIRWEQNELAATDGDSTPEPTS
jgi:hypothetical protein